MPREGGMGVLVSWDSALGGGGERGVCPTPRLRACRGPLAAALVEIFDHKKD